MEGQPLFINKAVQCYCYSVPNTSHQVTWSVLSGGIQDELTKRDLKCSAPVEKPRLRPPPAHVKWPLDERTPPVGEKLERKDNYKEDTSTMTASVQGQVTRSSLELCLQQPGVLLLKVRCHCSASRARGVQCGCDSLSEWGLSTRTRCKLVPQATQRPQGGCTQ